MHHVSRPGLCFLGCISVGFANPTHASAKPSASTVSQPQPAQVQTAARCLHQAAAAETPAGVSLVDIPSLAGRDSDQLTVPGPSSDTYDDPVFGLSSSDRAFSPVDGNDASETLFGAQGVAALGDIVQSPYLGDCVVGAVLGAIIDANPHYMPTILQDRGQQGADDGYRVLLYAQGDPIWVNVDDTFLTDSWGHWLSNTRVTYQNKSVIWPPLVDKALAKLGDKFYDIYSDDFDVAAQGYETIEGVDAQKLMEVLTNQPASYLRMADWSGQAMLAALQTAEAGGMATFGTRTVHRLFADYDDYAAADTPMDALTPGYADAGASPVDEKMTDQGNRMQLMVDAESGYSFLRIHTTQGERFDMVPNHAYTILNVDPAQQRVRLRNPWGLPYYLSTPATFWLPMSVLQDTGHGVTLIDRLNAPPQLRGAASALPVPPRPAIRPPAPAPSMQPSAPPAHWPAPVRPAVTELPAPGRDTMREAARAMAPQGNSAGRGMSRPWTWAGWPWRWGQPVEGAYRAHN